MIPRWYATARARPAALIGKSALLLSMLVLVSAMLLGSGFVAGQEETATTGSDSVPVARFEVAQRLVHYCHSCRTGGTWTEANLTTIEITHLGGNTLDISRIALRVNGNGSVYGSVPRPQEWNPHYPGSYPVPDFTQTFDATGPVTFSSGQTWRLHSYGNGADFEGLSHERYARAFQSDDCDPAMHFMRNNPPASSWHQQSCDQWVRTHTNQPLASGDDVAVVWQSASGDETQTLFRYTVAPDDAPMADRRKTSSPVVTDTAPDRTETGSTADAEQRVPLSTVDQAAQQAEPPSDSGGRPIAPNQLPAFLVGLFLAGCLVYGTHRLRRGDTDGAGEGGTADPSDEFVSKTGGQISKVPKEGGPPPEILREPDRNLTYDRLDLEDPIGKGGNADVYRAIVRDAPDVPPFALKQPRFEGTIHEETVDRFTREAETWERLDDHDHIVGVIDWDTEPLPWIAMEYMDAGDLSARSGDLTFPQAVWTAGRILEGVRHAHEHGVIHLDLKPSNILLKDAGDEYWDIPKIGDWGLAKLLLDHSKSVEELSPEYAAPEQFDPEEFGGTDKQTDIYQLGSIFYELFVGEPAFEGSAASVLRSKLDGEVTRPSAVNPVLPPALDDVLLKAMAVEKAQRYESVIVFRNELRDLLTQL
jgi:tRNA A-37 threonylcarbamoyl transferase component Bud32